jgi:hypothetical protein
MTIATLVEIWKKLLRKLKDLLTPGKDAWMRTP